MAATYGYGGEFSSDEDIDKIEQQAERFVESRFSQVKPTKNQIEETIENVRRLPIEQDVNLTDELLAGLLDYYKTQRGPIVDSTRTLYKKIVLRLIRGEQQQGGNSDSNKEQNGNSNNNNNNNNIIYLNKSAAPPVVRPLQVADTFSSDDDDEPMPQASDLDKRKFDSRVVYNNNNVDAEDKMDVDPETPTGPIRQSKQVDISTDEDTEATDDESETSDDDSEELDVTPIKPPNQPAASQAQKNVITPKPSTESAVKKQPLAQSTPKEYVESAKKPYTRSQRVATRASAMKEKRTELDAATNKPALVTTSVSQTGVQSNRSTRRTYALVTVTMLVLLLAALFYQFRTQILERASPIFSRKITF